VSLSAHLTAGTADHGRLAFHPECPRCTAERLAGSFGADSLVSRRAQAALVAGLLAFSAGAAPAAAQMPQDDPEQQETPAPGGEPPGLSPDFDPGSEDTFDYETAPLPGGPEAGGEEDEGLGAPVETEPATDIEAPPVVEDTPEAPPAAPEPAPAPAPAPTPTPPPAAATPAPPPPTPAVPPAAELEQPAPPPEQRKTSTKRKTPERGPKTHTVERAPAIGTSPTPAPQNAAPVVQPVEAPAPPTTVPVSQPAPPATVPVSQPSEPASAPITGSSYTVRAGDSLWSIARRLLGPEASAGRIAREVNRLWELNQDRIGTRNPSLIHIGTVLEL
jgi:LysM domain